jgi:PAS domain S-box-containing protein
MDQDTLKEKRAQRDRLRSRRTERRIRSKGSGIPRPPVEAAAWDWDLASNTVEWDPGLSLLFGYSEKVTDAAWREERIHPDDRERVRLSRERATIANHGAPWSEECRFRKPDGSYARVCDHARVLDDRDGLRRVMGALSLAARKES